MFNMIQRLGITISSAAVLLTSSAGIVSAQSTNSLQELINQNRISIGRDEVIQEPTPAVIEKSTTNSLQKLVTQNRLSNGRDEVIQPTPAGTSTLVAAPVSDSSTGLLDQSNQMRSETKSGLQKLLNISSQEPNSRR